MMRRWAKDTRILVVEDDRLSAQLYSYRLKLEGLEVVSAQEGLEALGWLGREPFHAVVTDLLMPGMGGLQLIREIRASSEPWNETPILVISSNPNEDEQVASFHAGADDFMGKPISIPVFMERLYRLLHGHHRGHP